MRCSPAAEAPATPPSNKTQSTGSCVDPEHPLAGDSKGSSLALVLYLIQFVSCPSSLALCISHPLPIPRIPSCLRDRVDVCECRGGKRSKVSPRGALNLPAARFLQTKRFEPAQDRCAAPHGRLRAPPGPRPRHPPRRSSPSQHVPTHQHRPGTRPGRPCPVPACSGQPLPGERRFSSALGNRVEIPFLPGDRDTTVPVTQCNRLCHVTPWFRGDCRVRVVHAQGALRHESRGGTLG
jgi:hypothetical protein